MKLPLKFKPEVDCLSPASLYDFVGEEEFICGSDETYGYSGLSNELVHALKGRSGRDFVLNWLRRELQLPEGDLANKETLRVALHLIQQHREQANPSRSPKQMLNRRFYECSISWTKLSSSNQPTLDKSDSSESSSGKPELASSSFNTDIRPIGKQLCPGM